jgi:hypothetical protein
MSPIKAAMISASAMGSSVKNAYTGCASCVLGHNIAIVVRVSMQTYSSLCGLEFPRLLS